MNFFLLFFCSLFLLGAGKMSKTIPNMPSTASSQPASLEKELKNYQEKLQRRTDLTVAFIQTTYKDLRKNTLQSRGMASFHRPNQFRWSTQKPIALEEEWIFTGSELFSHKKQTFTRYKISGSIGREIQQVVDMVINFDQLIKKYTLKRITKENHLVTIILIPHAISDLQAASLQLDVQKNFISQVRLDFVGNNHTTFDFSQPDERTLAPEIFLIPKGTVVKEAL